MVPLAGQQLQKPGHAVSRRGTTTTEGLMTMVGAVTAVTVLLVLIALFGWSCLTIARDTPDDETAPARPDDRRPPRAPGPRPRKVA